MNTFKSSAIQVLKKTGKPLHYSDITKMALEAGILVAEGATPEATMCALLIMDVKNKGKASEFIKTKTSTFALNPNIERKIKERAIYEVNNKIGYALSIKIRDNKIYLGGGHDMSYFLNKWDLIR